MDNPLLFDGQRYRMDFDGLERLLSDGAKMLVRSDNEGPFTILLDTKEL